MKLIICKKCKDVFNLRPGIIKECSCGQSKGMYLDNDNAEYSGLCIPLGFENVSLIEALADRPEEGSGRRFEAFVIPRQCETFKKKNLGPKPR